MKPGMNGIFFEKKSSLSFVQDSWKLRQAPTQINTAKEFTKIMTGISGLMWPRRDSSHWIELCGCGFPFNVVFGVINDETSLDTTDDA